MCYRDFVIVVKLHRGADNVAYFTYEILGAELQSLGLQDSEPFASVKEAFDFGKDFIDEHLAVAA